MEGVALRDSPSLMQGNDVGSESNHAFLLTVPIV